MNCLIRWRRAIHPFVHPFSDSFGRGGGGWLKARIKKVYRCSKQSHLKVGWKVFCYREWHDSVHVQTLSWKAFLRLYTVRATNSCEKESLRQNPAYFLTLPITAWNGHDCWFHEVTEIGGHSPPKSEAGKLREVEGVSDAVWPLTCTFVGVDWRLKVDSSDVLLNSHVLEIILGERCSQPTWDK